MDTYTLYSEGNNPICQGNYFSYIQKNWLILYWGLTSLDYINTFINLLNMFGNEEFEAGLSKGYNLQLLLQVLVWKL